MSESNETTNLSRSALDRAVTPRDASRLEATGGLPTRKHEEWRFVRLKRLLDVERYTQASPTGEDPVAQLSDTLQAELREKLGAIEVEEAKGRLVVCINGVMSARLSDLDDVKRTKGLDVACVKAEQQEGGVGELSALLQGGADYFTVLSDEAWQQAVVVTVDRDVSAGCMHLVHVEVDTARDGAATLATPRLKVSVGRGSKFSIVEDHVSLGASDDAALQLSIPVVEIELGENARCDHVKVQQLDHERSFHMARQVVKVVEGAHYASVTFHEGAAISRQDMHAEIAGGNTMCALHGLALIHGKQLSDTHSVMNHVHPHANSDQVHKCVIGDRGHAIFNGKIFVREGAQQIDAFQLNRNLLLSDRAQIDTKPQLEIFADDVKCSHGATIGQLDEDQLFYLQARGIDKDEARGLLTYAFAAELVDRVPTLSVRKRVSDMILHKTSMEG